MKKFFSKKRNIVISIILVVALLGGGVFAYFYFRPKTASDEMVYVSSVATITGQNANGMNNRYAGVVESQESWNVTADSSLKIEETFVEVGQEVEEGTPLFSYDVTETENNLRTAKLDLERMNNSLTALKNTIDELAKSRDAAADESIRAEYNIELQQKQLDYTGQEYAISSKQEEIKKLEETVKKAVVTSKISGIVKSIANDNNMYMENSNAYITVVNMNKFQVKGSINEQNLSSLYQDAPVIVYSRKDEGVYWKGTVTKIDSNGASSNSSSDPANDSMTSSSRYPFYVSLEDTTGLNMGQHVYIELDVGQLEGNTDPSKIYLEDYYIDRTDEDNPCVWVDRNGRIAKQSVKLGDYNTETFKYEILEGLELSDLIAMPYEGLKEGAKTINTEEESGGIYEDADGDLSPEEMGIDTGEEYLEEDIGN